MRRLVFVYNANSGRANAVLDSIHKVVSPSTYNCNLCELTFDIFSENKTWKSFRENSKMDLEFYHKDEFLKKYKSNELSKFDFPVILSEENNELSILISSEELSSFETTSGLIEEISFRIILY